jgi:hypothetical protein
MYILYYDSLPVAASNDSKPYRYHTTNETGTPRACEVCEEFTHFGPEVGH